MQTTQLKTAAIHSFISEPAWIRCESGQLWISHDGEDIILARGEKCLISGNDLVVIEALQDSQFSTTASTTNSANKQSLRLDQLATAH
ncbi:MULTISPECIES: DUF2917 domain-containing protein [Deefgea]|uniref:DUF2917 domain-containing protein n=1 Tax=Deefgea chitinilytica TaxID=570276 RepID=A0ABS2CBQ0_9NEIS|nr:MULTISPECIES: DUF2917 domain-containing protein [Deefgea]MBM5570786.1 DUF2917 domain-containing protein [Deefgea chitinilytica]MBM9888015.1 DUF2917 domain-containing protein [Deefgea sp. CFH1-16]